MHAVAEALRPSTTVSLDDVSVVSDSLLTGLMIDADGRRAVVPRYELLRGTTVVHAGDRGRLVLTRELAERLGLA